MLVFARLIKDEWFYIGDLEGLAESKIDRLEALINL